MKFIINHILDIIKENQIGGEHGESIYRIDGFDNPRLYWQLAMKIHQTYGETKSISIKMAGNKWHAMENICDTESKNIFEKNDWLALDKSVTYYRNQHSSDMLFLFGTELEDDTGGLLNCFVITPKFILNRLEGQYWKIFADCFIEELADSEKDYVNTIYGALFRHRAPDICKLSDIADKWERNFDNIDEFKEEFFSSLREWDLPNWALNTPTDKEIDKYKQHIFEGAYEFINRIEFDNLKVKDYEKLVDRIENYDGEYSATWGEWRSQGFSDYDDFSTTLKAFIRSENIKSNRKRLLKCDYTIIKDVLKVKKGKRISKNKKIKVSGEPLRAMYVILFKVLQAARAEYQEDFAVNSIRFDFVKADIVTGYTDGNGEDKVDILRRIWKNICIHTNGVINFVDEKANWQYDGQEFVINSNEAAFFSLDDDTIEVNIDTGKVSVASATSKVSKVDLKVILEGKAQEKIFEQEFCWCFQNDDSWLFAFSWFSKQNVDIDPAIVPIVKMDNIQSLAFVKSAEEFFDSLEACRINFNFNLVKYINEKISNSYDKDDFLSKYRAFLRNLGEKYNNFVLSVRQCGFYNSINDQWKDFRDAYKKMADEILKMKQPLPENQYWLLDAFNYAFTVIENPETLCNMEKPKMVILPPWHPAALEMLISQKDFVRNGVSEFWQKNEEHLKDKKFISEIDNLYATSEIQASVDLFSAPKSLELGAIASYHAYTLYGNGDFIGEVNTRIKDVIKKEAIFDEEFSKSEITTMNDSAKMIYDVIEDYIKAMPIAEYNIRFAFINPTELQPIIAAICKYINEKSNEKSEIDVTINILVKPENKGGRSYLAYWLDENFSQEDDIHVRTYLNEWKNPDDLESLLDSNNDIIFYMDFMVVDSFEMIKSRCSDIRDDSDSRFPIIYRPVPISQTSIYRRIEISQPQFAVAFKHTQLVNFSKAPRNLPEDDMVYIATCKVKPCDANSTILDIIHKKAYWVVCIDRTLDGSLLRKDNPDNYQVLGFSTGKGLYGQYNLTITTRRTIFDSLKLCLRNQLCSLFGRDESVTDATLNRILDFVKHVDGISMLSIMNRSDKNMREFMAYILTAMWEKKETEKKNIKIIVRLDSYKHWFYAPDQSKSMPDILVLSISDMCDEVGIKIDATVIECKIAKYGNKGFHIDNARNQIENGLQYLQSIFNNRSESIKKRYWFAQLYRALVFSEIVFSDNESEFETFKENLRGILDGKFSIEWHARIMGYWIDCQAQDNFIEDFKVSRIAEHGKIYNIPQVKIKEILSDRNDLEFSVISDEEFKYDDTEDKKESDTPFEQAEREELKRISIIENSNSVSNETANIETKGLILPQYNAELKVKNDDEGDVANTTSLQEDASSINISNKAVISETSNESISCESNIHAARVLIGKARLGNEIYWDFGHPALANRHLLITGTSGQGKTYSIQTMLYEIAKFGVSSVIFDYTEGFREDQLEEKFKSKMADKIDYQVLYVVGVPVNPFKRNEIEIAGYKTMEKIGDVAQRVANILTHVYNFGEQQFAAIYDACREGMEKYADNMSMRILENELKNSSNKAAKTVVSKMAPFFHSIEFKNENLDWNEVLYAKENKVTIFQLTNFVRDIQVIITEFLLWDIWHFTKKYGSKDKPFVVVLDEAQNLDHGQDAPSGMILTEGRKFGWSAWYATQSLKVLSADEVTRLSQAAFKLNFRPTDDEIASMARQLNITDPNEWKDSLLHLQKGQCIVAGSRLQKSGTFGTGRPIVTNVTSFEERL